MLLGEILLLAFPRLCGELVPFESVYELGSNDDIEGAWKLFAVDVGGGDGAGSALAVVACFNGDGPAGGGGGGGGAGGAAAGGVVSARKAFRAACMAIDELMLSPIEEVFEGGAGAGERTGGVLGAELGGGGGAAGGVDMLGGGLGAAMGGGGGAEGGAGAAACGRGGGAGGGAGAAADGFRTVGGGAGFSALGGGGGARGGRSDVELGRFTGFSGGFRRPAKIGLGGCGAEVSGA